MRSQRKGGLSATTKVKVFSPEISTLHWAKESIFWKPVSLHALKGEYVRDVPGSESVAGKLTVDIGTWESRITPNISFQQAEEARRKYGDTAVGLTHSRGVGGVMPAAFRELGILEGVSSKTQRDEYAGAVRRDG